MGEIDKDKCIRKWGPIIENIGIFNNQFVELISLFCEWYSFRGGDVYYGSTVGGMPTLPYTNTINVQAGSADTLSDLPKIIHEISNKVSSLKRVEIVGTYLNVGSGTLDYKLSNGDYVNKYDLDNRKVIILTDFSFESLVDIFPLDFLTFIYKEDSRNFKIDSIVNFPQ